MHRLNGGCYCGNITLEVDLHQPPNTYEPRSCDCDFCIKHGAAYISDPQGAVSIRIEDGADCQAYRQGSGVAAFLVCKRCGVLTAALYRGRADERWYATVNSVVLNNRPDFGRAKAVSPKKLSGPEKIGRWQEIWFADVGVAVHRGEISGLEAQ